MPFINSTSDGSTTTIPAFWLNRIGTRTEAPNIANRCCRLRGIPLSSGTFSSTWMIGREALALIAGALPAKACVVMSLVPPR